MFGRGDFCQIGTLPTLSACPLAPIAPGLRSPTGVSFPKEATSFKGSGGPGAKIKFCRAFGDGGWSKNSILKVPPGGRRKRARRAKFAAALAERTASLRAKSLAEKVPSEPSR